MEQQFGENFAVRYFVVLIHNISINLINKIFSTSFLNEENVNYNEHFKILFYIKFLFDKIFKKYS